MIFPLIGNARVKDAVLSAVLTDRIPHAVIIEGDKGSGKHTLADFIVSAAVCTGEEKPCGVCNNCHLAAIKSHPDITDISAEQGKKNISVGQVRELRNEAYVKPHQARRRVFIINGADTMNEQAQNALLKVLEEPPGDIIFILVAESKQQLLATIISRCVLFSLCAPEREEAVKYICGKNASFSYESVAEALDNNSGNIGAALDDLTGNKSEIKSAAEDFLKAAVIPNEWDMLVITRKFEKDRVSAERFSAQLKLCVAEKLKRSTGNVRLSKRLFSFYESISEVSKALKTNINLSLYFTLIVSKAGEIFGG